jgi:uncharacterized protein YecT (DUF1311 family)
MIRGTRRLFTSWKQKHKFALSAITACFLVLGSLTIETKAQANCLDSTLEETQCLARDVRHHQQRYAQLMQQMHRVAQWSRSSAATFLRLSDRAFKQYMIKNCESEGHDAMGGSAEDTLVLACQARLLRQRNQDLEALLKRSPQEREIGQAVCRRFDDSSLIGSAFLLSQNREVERLRLRLDRVATDFVSGLRHSTPAQKREWLELPRRTHQAAEGALLLDSSYFCMTALKAICPRQDAPDPLTAEELAATRDHFTRRDAWLDRCQAQMRMNFILRASSRLHFLESL